MRIAFGDARLDTDARTLEREGRRVPVEPKVFDLLVYLIEHRDRVASTQELLDVLWPGISVGPAALSGAVHKARQAVGDDGEQQAVLRTVHGRGFQFVAEVTDAPAAPEAPPPPPGARARRLAAILFSDIVGYTALMESDEARALAARDRHRALLRPIVEQLHGDLVEAPGDEALAVFASSLGAVDCALALQAALRDADDLKLRIGIHLGDVLFRDGEVIGEGVNVAARIRSLAEPGGICVSQAVYEQVKNHPHLHGRPLGSHTLKGVERPVGVFVLSAGRGERSAPRRRRPWLGLAAGAALLLAAASAWLLGRPAPHAPPGHSLAVLPFVNMSPDPDQAYFADGIAEELLNTVARFDALRVVGRTSSFSFRDSDADIKTIGEKLGADVILEGSVRSEGDRVRITAQLLNARDGYHLWSESYDRELGDIFAIQTEIATAIAAALRVQLSPEQRDRLAAAPTQNLQAYQAYLLGRQRLTKFTAASVAEGVRHLRQAIELDPKFALAHADLATGYLELFQLSDRPPGEMLARAQVAANRALQLDDGLAEAHVALGAVEWFRNDFEAAEAAFQRALTLNPSSVGANLWYGDLLGASLGRYEESLALRRKAVELDPLSLGTVPRLGISLEWVGRFDESLSWYERSLEIDPDFAWGHELIGDHHRFVSGRLDEALVWYAKAAALNHEAPTIAFVGLVLVDLGDPAHGGHWLHRSIEQAPENFYSNLAMGQFELYRGNEDAALEHVRKAFAIWPYEALTPLRDLEVRAGRYVEARALYEELFPELLYERDPELDFSNHLPAIDLAWILSRTGESERADLLLARALQLIQKRRRLGEAGYGLADVQIHALRGEKQKALAALHEAIDEGWRAGWWYQLEYKPDLEPLHGDPEYQAMVDEIRADMAAQLAHVREMEQSGELVFPAELPTPGPHASRSARDDPR